MYINTRMSIHIYAYTGTCKCVCVYTEGPPLCDIPLPHVWHDPYMSVTRQVVEQECGDGRTFKGVCTWYLKHLAPGKRVRGFLRRTRHVQSCCAHPCPRLFDLCDMIVYECDTEFSYVWHDFLAPGKTVCGFLRCTSHVKNWCAYARIRTLSCPALRSGALGTWKIDVLSTLTFHVTSADFTYLVLKNWCAYQCLGLFSYAWHDFL